MKTLTILSILLSQKRNKNKKIVSEGFHRIWPSLQAIVGEKKEKKINLVFC